ncbi:MAG: site-2 protease family protein [Candidatus Heimdallarchaeaceae archaeon]
MLTTFQIILIVLMGLLVLSFIGNMLNLQKYGIYIIPVGIIFRTKFFNKILEKMGDKGKRFWKFMYNTGKILTGIISLGLLGFFIVNPFLILFNSPVGIGIQLIIPGVTIDFKIALLFIFPILVVLIPHEIAHAIMARREGIEIKTSGIFLVLVFFGGFVELVRESLEKAEAKSKIRVLLNGSAINAVFSVLFVALYFLTPAIVSIGYDPTDGVLITNIYDDYPADLAGIEVGDVIVSIGKYNDSLDEIIYSPARSVNDYNAIMLANLETEPFYVTLLDDSNITIVPTKINPSSNKTSTTTIYLGVNIYNYYPPKASWQTIWFPYYWDLQISYTLNISLMAVFLNMLPLVMTDGDKILQIYLKNKVTDEPKYKRILNGIRIASLLILVINIILPMLL